VAELLRNSPTYRRTDRELGYYWNLNDYVDAQTWMDWRSGARERAGDPGYVRGQRRDALPHPRPLPAGAALAFQEWFRDGRRNVA
jgi:hypothetical protein